MQQRVGQVGHAAGNAAARRMTTLRRPAGVQHRCSPRWVPCAASVIQLHRLRPAVMSAVGHRRLLFQSEDLEELQCPAGSDAPASSHKRPTDAEQAWPHVGSVDVDPSTGFTGIRHVEDGVMLAPGCKIDCFWDLDNLKPGVYAAPGEQVKALKQCLSQLGEVRSVRAFGNPSTFSWVQPVDKFARTAEKELIQMERQMGRAVKKGGVKSCRCDFCGQGFATEEKLKKHFVQLHVREMKKRTSGPPKRVQKVLKNKERMDRYKEAKHSAMGTHGSFMKTAELESGLKAAGVQVFKVSKAKQAADTAINMAIERLLQQPQACTPATAAVLPFTRAVCIVSDDSGYTQIMQRARAAGICVIAFCSERILARGQELKVSAVIHVDGLALGNSLGLPTSRKDIASLLHGGTNELRTAAGAVLAMRDLSRLAFTPAQFSFPGAHITADYRTAQALAVGLTSVDFQLARSCIDRDEEEEGWGFQHEDDDEGVYQHEDDDEEVYHLEDDEQEDEYEDEWEFGG